MGPRRAPAQQRDWLALPGNVLQHIICLASTWQAPGCCVASAVCRTWRSAAVECLSRIQLLYHVGRGPADQSFATWLKLERNRQRLEALTLSGSNSDNILHSSEPIFRALTSRLLPLHTLRVLHGDVSVRSAGQLLAVLPQLRRLQLEMSVLDGGTRAPVLQQQLAPLQGATQLEELYFKGPNPTHPSLASGLARMLPVGLKRLSWEPVVELRSHNLSHLTGVTFLQLTGWTWNGPRKLTSNRLPPGLQQLEVMEMGDVVDLMEEQQESVTAWDVQNLEDKAVQQQLSSLPNLQAVAVQGRQAGSPAAQAALEQAPKLSALTVYCDPEHELRGMCAGLATAANISSLRRLHFCLDGLPDPGNLVALAELQPQGHVTQLRLSVDQPASCTLGQQRAWEAVVGSFNGLRWLSVPDVMLGAGSAWLGDMQQLRVLVVKCREAESGTEGSSMPCPWLEGCTSEGLPPQLRVLGVSGMTAEQAASMQLRRCLYQLVGSSGCEVVVGVSLDEAADPTQQLAGLPVALQQDLA
jgi:hypothetical protein